MARVTLGAIATDIRGKLGGQVFKQSAGGLVIQTKRNSVPPKGQILIVPVAINKGVNKPEINNAWRLLTEQQKEVWASYAEFLNGRYILKKNANSSGLSVYNWFAYVNYFNAYFGHTILTAPSFSLMVEDCELLDAVKTNGSSLVIVDANVYTTSFKIALRMSNRMRVNSKTNQSKPTTLLKSVTAATTNYDVTTEYLAKYGQLPAVGDWVKIGWDSYTTTQGRQIRKTNYKMVQVTSL